MHQFFIFQVVMTKSKCFQRRKPPGENPEDEFKTGEDQEETKALNEEQPSQQQQRPSDKSET